jgi:hypothetical protein
MIQWHVRVLRKSFSRIQTRADMRAAIQYWLDTGKQKPGLKVSATVWKEGYSSPTPLRQVRREMRGCKLTYICPGLVSHYAEPNRTLCDYDTQRAPNLKRVWSVAQQLGIVPLAVEYQKSKRGWHLAVTWNRDFSPAEIVAIQLLLGSDRYREMFNLARILSRVVDTRKCANILFLKKLPVG